MSCWGDGGEGQLGATASPFSADPLAIGGIAGATQVSSGLDYSCALLGGGSVKCWGLNDAKQLGNGTDANPKDGVPTTVSGLAGVKQAALPDTSGGDDDGDGGSDGSGNGSGNGTTTTTTTTATPTTTPAPPATTPTTVPAPTPARATTPAAKPGFPASTTSRTLAALGKGTTLTVTGLKAGTTARVRVTDGTRSLGLLAAKVGANGRAALKIRLDRAERARLRRLRRKALTLRWSVTDQSGRAVRKTATLKLA